MINQEILREYDIRGIFQKSLTLKDVEYISFKLATIIKETQSHQIIIGHDGRNSSLEIKNTLIENFLSFGIDVYDISLIPTPVSYFANKYFKVPNLIMITGSHNPKEYNGLKIIIDEKPFFGDRIKTLNQISDCKRSQSAGNLYFKSPIEPYSNEILDRFKNINKLKIVWDPGNGAIAPIIHRIVETIGGNNIILNRSIDSTFPNHHPDPTIKKNIIQISEYVKQHYFDLGISFDGDGDRVGIIDNNGQLIYSDIILLLLVLDLHQEKKDITAVADVKCSKILFDTLKSKGINILMSKTGHSLIKEMINSENVDIAGEMSGHIFYKYQYYGYDDAIFASLKIVNLLNQSDLKLSEITKPYLQSSSTPEIKLHCAEKDKFQILSNLIDKIRATFINQVEIIDIDGVRVESKDFWFLIRASNTQNCLVFRLEHFDSTNFKIEINKLIEILQNYKLDISELTGFNNTI
ncbi:phosphomannomutase/phosphoglucomutase [Alphaproteobacteria bacterium]|nr:phosphomannomutase/phosphoglucomutase [Alphaproteobacteria bacterium]